MNPLHEQFVAEARELALQASNDLIDLEREGFDPGRVERILRSFHTLKGSAGVVQLPAMSLMLHAAEDLMIAIQEQRLSGSSDLVSDALRCIDLVSQWVDAFELHGELPPDAGEQGRAMAERLRRHAEGSAAPQAPMPGAAGVPDWASRLLRSLDGSAVERDLSGGDGVFAILYEPHAGCFYDGDDPLRLMQKIPHLLALNMELPGEQPALADLDPFACRLRLEALAGGTQRELSALFQSRTDQVRIIPLPPQVVPARNARPVDQDTDLVRAVVKEQRQLLQVNRSENLAGCIVAAARSAANALRHGRRDDLADAITRAGEAAIANLDTALLDAALAEAEAALSRSALEEDAAAPDGSARAKRGETESVTGRLLRVDEARIESLVNLAGELIVLKNSFGHLAKRIESEDGSRDLVQAARHEYDAIERLAADMQRAVLQLRMVTFAQVLRPFPRLVRDLSQQLGKKVSFVTQGETTECDKTVVDRLFEPLLHLVRNALDHGIEKPEERAAAGKNASATLTIQALRAGDRIVVEVTDDGRGIDPAIIRRKAFEKGLLSDETAAALPEDKVLELIFSTGFSTARQASEISGRGVGMDVVRTTVEQIGGRVSIDSGIGKGTTIRLDVPMNIATSRIMVVECAGQSFGIPMDHVVETVRLTPDRIRTVKNNEGFVLRDRVIPICSLAELMNLPTSRRAAADTRLVLVADTGGKVAAVEIDAIRDRLDVVLKPMQGLLAHVNVYAGTTLLGNGAVLLVVDLKEALP